MNSTTGTMSAGGSASDTGTDKLAVHARFTAQPGRGEELVDAVRSMYATAEDEQGTLLYAAHRDRDDADVVMMYELYASDEAFDVHGESPAAGRLGEQLGDLLARDPEVWFTRPLRMIGWSEDNRPQ